MAPPRASLSNPRRPIRGDDSHVPSFPSVSIRHSDSCVWPQLRHYRCRLRWRRRASRLLSLTIVSIKPGMMQAYIDFQKSEAIPAMQKGGQMWRESWRTAVFGDPNEVAHVTEIKGFEQYDSPSPLRKALGEAGYTAYLAKISAVGHRPAHLRHPHTARPGLRCRSGSPSEDGHPDDG